MMTRRQLRTISLGLLVAGCGNPPPTTKPSNGSNGVAAGPATIEQLCKALEVCGQMPGLCERPIGLNIWLENAAWRVKVVMAQPGETNKEALIDLDKGTCDGVPAKLPEVSGGVTVDSVIAGVRACASGPPWNGKTKNGAIEFRNPVVSRFTMEGGPPQHSVYLSDGSAKTFALNIDLATGKCSE